MSQTVNGIFLVTSKDGEEPGQGGVSVLISPVKLISVTQPQHSPLSDLCYPPLVNTHGAVPTLVHSAKLRRSAPMDYQQSVISCFEVYFVAIVCKEIIMHPLNQIQSNH